jgi:hypothetical protein
MMPIVLTEQAPVPPPAYHRAQARLGPALHIDALTEVAHAASAHALSAGGAPGTSSVSAALTGRPRRRAAHLWRRLLAAPRTATHAVAAVVTGHA